jgi:hypothetical protein
VSSAHHSIDPGAAVLAGVACLALIAGATVKTLPHLILGVVVLAFANQLDPARLLLDRNRRL